MESNYFGVFEIKYITKIECDKLGDKIVDEKTKEAVEQIKIYKDSKELLSVPNLKKWGEVFVFNQ